MRTVRFLVYGVPLALVLLVVAAFLNSTHLVSRKKNEFTFGTIGEPTKLNPILSTDDSATEVESMIFEPLVTLNEHMEIEPVLAARFTERQLTTFFFQSFEAAAAAEQALLGAKASWHEWKLQSIERKGASLVLTQTQPGSRLAREIAKKLNAADILPVVDYRVDLPKDARKALAAFRAEQPGVRVVREWFDYDLAFEIKVLDDGSNAEEKLKNFVGTLGDKARLTAVERHDFIAEPVIDFQLRRDVKWHDGAPFTSRDCVFTYECLMSEEVASPRKSNFDAVQSVSAPNPHEFVVTYRRPYSPALLRWSMGILPEHILRGKSQRWWAEHFNRHPVGTGPFKFSEWLTNQYVKLVRNDAYWAPGPWLDAFYFRSMPDPTVLRLAFETHQLDIYQAVLSPWAIESYRKDPRFTVLDVPSFAFSFLGWNLRNPLFQDLRVRQAFTLAINIPDLIKYVAYGNGEPARGIFSLDFWFADRTMQTLPYDPKRAAELLDEAGWKRGPDGVRVKDGRRLTFKLLTNQGNEARRDIATVVQDALGRLGVDVKVEIYEWAVFIQRFILKQEFDAAVFAWVSPPDWDVYEVWHSSQTHIDQLNFIGYSNPEADRLILELREEYDHDRIKALASQLQRRIYDDQPVLFINSSQDPQVIWKDSFRIRRRTASGWIDTPFQVVPNSWNYFVPVTYRTEYASELPADTTPK